MATKATGVFKEVRYKKEVAGQWGELNGPSGGVKLRRVTADFNPTADTYSSNEINTTFQNTDTRLGVRGAEGSLNGELSPGSYADFFGSVLARDFTSVVGVNDAEVTIAAAGTNFTITRSDALGDYLADGIKVGQVVRMTGAGLNAANVGNNLLVISVTATVLTVMVLSSTSLVAEGPISTVDIAPAGKVTYIPQTGHTDDSYNIEEWYSDIQESAVFTGMKVGSANVSLPSTGMVTTDFSFMGKGLTSDGTVAYFTSPTGPSTTGLLTAVQGALLINGSASACITDASIGIERANSPAQCVGSNFNSEIFVGKITVSGSISAYFSDSTLRDYFDNETDVSIVLVATTGEDKAADFISFTIPRAKLTSFSNQDNELGIISGIDYQAVMNNVTSSGLINSTIMIQDSAA